MAGMKEVTSAPLHHPKKNSSVLQLCKWPCAACSEHRGPASRDCGTHSGAHGQGFAFPNLASLVSPGIIRVLTRVRAEVRHFLKGSASCLGWTSMHWRHIAALAPQCLETASRPSAGLVPKGVRKASKRAAPAFSTLARILRFAVLNAERRNHLAFPLLFLAPGHLPRAE